MGLDFFFKSGSDPFSKTCCDSFSSEAACGSLFNNAEGGASSIGFLFSESSPLITEARPAEGFPPLMSRHVRI